MYLSLHCHHQNDFCIKVGSDESHFNVSLIVRTQLQDSVLWTQPADPQLPGQPYRVINKQGS